MTTPKERALPLLKEALSILLSDDSRNRDKLTEDYVRRAKNRIVKSIFWNKDEPSESVKEEPKNSHVEETPFVYVATSMREGKVDGQRVALEEVF